MCPAWLRLVSLVPLVLAACPPPQSGEEDTTSAEKTTTGSTAPTNTTDDCPIGMEGCPCTGGGACDPGLECNADNRCEATGGVTTESVTSTPPMTTGSSSTAGEDDTSTGTTEPVGPQCTPPGDGTESAECIALDPNKPFCVVDTCQPCGALDIDACIEATDGARPICMPAGNCVQCDSKTALADFQCEAATPHCNLDTNTCEGCFEHSECPDTACDVAERQCFPKSKVLWIRQGTMACSDDPMKGGGMGMPFCDFQTALAAAQQFGDSGYTFRLMGNIDDISPGAVQVTNAGPPVSYAFVHEPGGPGDVHTQFVGQGPLIVVGKNVRLYINDFAVLPTGLIDTSRGIDCQEGGEVWLDDSRVTGSRGPGIRGTACKIHLRRSAISHGKTEGIDMTGGSLFAVNSFITDNAFVAKFGGGGLVMRGGATADITFSTIADNLNEPSLGRGDSIHCDDQVSVKIRNSIIVRDPTSGNISVVCGEMGDPPVDWVDADNNLVDTVLGGNNNEKIAAENILPALIGNSSGVYRINTGAQDWMELFLKAEWQLGDPHCDFEWEPRNAVVKGKNIVGADTVP